MAQAHPERASNGNRLQRPPPCDGKAAPETARWSGWAVAAAAALIALAGPCRAAPAADPQGVWMIEDEVAIAVARCGGDSLCGRIVWLRTARDDAGRPRRDAMNPDSALRDRPLCGLTVLDGLLPVPDGPGYGLAAALGSADVLVARVYIGMPFLGVNQTLLRVQPASGEGWC